MILPKGIVRNTDAIYAALASFSVVPPEILWGCWHVYTYTSRKLNDPTAHRLENFWWHVLGSDRRYLSGRALAKIYEEISNGPTFVPLKGPVNRYEGPPIPRLSQHELDRIMSGSELPPKEAQGARGKARDRGSPPKQATKEPTSSSTRPPPLHPILKNTRGPSSSGPRPTARFVSPPDSGDEGAASSGSTAVSERQPQPPPPPAARSEKKTAQTSKKFVATTSASKRRPVLPRRPSSQSSSTPSDAGSREGSTGPSTKHVASQQQSPSAAEHSATKGSQGSPKPSTLSEGAVLSTKAAGKQPAKLASEKKTARDKPTGKGDKERTAVVRQQAMAAQGSPGSSSGDSASSASEVDGAKEGLKGGGVSPVAITSQSMARSHSNIEHRTPSSHQSSAGRRPPGGLAASSITATSNIAIQGQFDFNHPTPAAASLEARDMPDNVSLASRQSSTSLFTPTQPSPTTVPLGRSKSQLAVLLELDKDRARHQGQNGSHKKEKRADEHGDKR